MIRSPGDCQLDRPMDIIIYSYTKRTDIDSEDRRETDRHTDRDGQRRTETDRQRQTERQRKRQTNRQLENSNSKTLFFKDCSLGLLKNLTSPC